MKLIDADALKSSIAELKKSPWFNTKEGFAYRKEAIEFVERLCVDKEPMVIPVKQGYWIKMSDADGIFYSCSQCGEWYKETSNYCPNCGVKMGGEWMVMPINTELPSISLEQSTLKQYSVYEIKLENISEANYIDHLIDDLMEKWQEDGCKPIIVLTREGKEIGRFEIL